MKLSDLESSDDPDTPPTHSEVKKPSQPKSKKIYSHATKLVLKVPDHSQKELIYGRHVIDITKFTNKFKGRMLTYLTHGLLIYPAKFIPQIPQFCIQKFSNPTNFVLDPMCGSGTTLVESMLLHRNAYGIDINPLARLLSKVKTTPLDLALLSKEVLTLKEFLRTETGNNRKKIFDIPNFPNLAYWFDSAVIQDLIRVQQYILKIADSAIRDFLLLILASIIRDVSLADRDQLHPARTKYSRAKEHRTIKTSEIFKKALASRLSPVREFSKYDFSDVAVEIIGDDATRINCPSQVDLAVTSPPYVNALDYVRIHKLEAFWAGLLSADEIHPLHQQFIGTENVYKDYYNNLPRFQSDELNSLIAKIASFDRKRAGIVALYFSRMFENLHEVYRLLRPGGYYCIVIGSNNIRNIHIPTPKLLIEFAETEVGYQNAMNFSYDIINKRLKIPRARHGGNIKKEWIIVLQKS
jgi:DNA modification methylase